MATEEKDELVVIGDEDVATNIKKVDPPDEDDDKDDDKDDDEDEGAEASGKKDAKLGHTEGQEEGEDPDKATRRQERQARKTRQREARERTEKELAFLTRRNETLEKQLNSVTTRVQQTEIVTIQQRLAQVKEQIAAAKDVEAQAIDAGEGEDAVEAREIREGLEAAASRLEAASERLSQPKRPDDREPPPAARLALDWVKRHRTWYKPDASTEDSAIAQAVEQSMVREGSNPATEAHWVELDRRLKKRLPNVFKKMASNGHDEDEGDEDEDEEEETVIIPPKKKVVAKAKGPKISVGGQERHLKPNEVYISPERKAAMEEAGVWDDPKLRQKYLKRYQQWDQENRA